MPVVGNAGWTSWAISLTSCGLAPEVRMVAPEKAASTPATCVAGMGPVCSASACTLVPVALPVQGAAGMVVVGPAVVGGAVVGGTVVGAGQGMPPEATDTLDSMWPTRTSAT